MLPPALTTGFLTSLFLPPESHYKEKLLSRCCKDGLREVPMPYSCTRRSLYITEGWECMRAFRYCCATYRNQEFNTEIPTTPPPTTPPPTTPPPTTTAPPRPTFPFRWIPLGSSRDFVPRNYCYSTLLSDFYLVGFWVDVFSLSRWPASFTLNSRW